jgi:hypothetical protein
LCCSYLHKLRYVEHVEQRGLDLFDAFCRRDLPGVVEKLA